MLDLTRLLPGAYCTQLLVDQGARVIKVEQPWRGDYLRTIPPLRGEMGAMFLAVNRGKESIAVDLQTAEGREVFHDLAAQAEVVVEGFRPGVLERLSLGPDTLHEHHPHLVICRLTGFGQDGPLRHRPGHDLNYLAISGVLQLLSGPDGPPVIPAVQLADLVGGMAAALGITIGLLGARRTGVGTVVDAAMTDALRSLLVVPAALAQTVQEAPAGSSELHGPVGTPPYDLYRSADARWLSLACLEPRFWHRLCELLDIPDVADLDIHDPTGHGQARARVAEVIGSRTLAQWEDLLGEENVCAAPVLDVVEALSHTHVDAREGMIDVADGTGTMRLPGPPFRVDSARASAHRPAPALGQHTRSILTELGRPQAAVEELVACGIVGTGQLDQEDREATR